jgi:hypothetical protein
MRVFSLFGRPAFLRGFHGWCVLIWFVLWGLATVFGWINQTQFVSHISMMALVLGSWSSWQAARVEVKQEAEIEKAENDN